MEKILVHTRCGLGDQIICNGLINHWSENKFVYLICRPFTLATLTCLYKDNPNVELRTIQSLELGVGHDEEVQALADELNVESIGIATHHVILARYQECMYDANIMKFMNGQIHDWARIPFGYRYSKFQLPKEIAGRQSLYNKLKPSRKYALLHTEGTSGDMFDFIEWDNYIDPNLDRIRILPETNNLLDWIDLIINAEEIHCVPSGPFHFIDSILPLVKAKKFFHNSRSGTNFNPNNEHNQHCWTVIEYDKKTSV